MKDFFPFTFLAVKGYQLLPLYPQTRTHFDGAGVFEVRTFGVHLHNCF